MLAESLKSEKNTNIKPNPDSDVYMKEEEFLESALFSAAWFGSDMLLLLLLPKIPIWLFRHRLCTLLLFYPSSRLPPLLEVWFWTSYTGQGNFHPRDTTVNNHEYVQDEDVDDVDRDEGEDMDMYPKDEHRSAIGQTGLANGSLE
ncbi:hypothetical protein Tco_1133205 [Tanacetum coccineum]